MLQKDTSKWPMVVCETAEDIPAGGLKIVRPEIVQQLGNTVDAMFPAFAAAFPQCAAAMKEHWSKPKLVVAPVGLDWIASVVLEGTGAKNIQIKHGWVLAEVDGPEFEEYKAMLPVAWKELYRWFDSFGLTDYPFNGDWINTPFNYASRLAPERYRQLIGGKKTDVRDFEKRFDSIKLRCWLLTDASDTLWLDEQRCDHKVYHLRGGNFKDVGVLANPAQALDTYLAHVLSGGKPADFDFYKWRV